MDKRNRSRLANERKEMQRPEKDKDVKKKIHASTRKVPQNKVGDSVCGGGSGREKTEGISKNLVEVIGEHKDK